MFANHVFYVAADADGGGGQLIFKVVHLAFIMMQNQLHLANKHERLLLEAAKTPVWPINLPHLV